MCECVCVGDEDDIDYMPSSDEAPGDMGNEKLRNLYANNARVGQAIFVG